MTQLEEKLTSLIPSAELVRQLDDLKQKNRKLSTTNQKIKTEQAQRITNAITQIDELQKKNQELASANEEMTKTYKERESGYTKRMTQLEEKLNNLLSKPNLTVDVPQKTKSDKVTTRTRRTRKRKTT